MDRKDAVAIASLKDMRVSLIIVLPIIACFEIFMGISWFFDSSLTDHLGFVSIGYLCSYAALFVFSIVLLAIVIASHEESRMKKLNPLTLVFSGFMVAWALFVTWLDAMSNIENVLLVVLVLILIPLIVVPSSIFILVLHAVCDTGMIVIASLYYNNLFDFIVNYAVFIILAIAISITYRKVRKKHYENLCELKELSDMRWRYANIDALTGLKNRRAYDEALDKLDKIISKPNIALVALDINGLKKTNDFMGHAAGDELIKGAADCIKEAFNEVGEAYRIGGDEFMVICMGNKAVSAAVNKLRELEKNWNGKIVSYLSISTGVAFLNDYPEESMKGLEKQADDKMYMDKKAYYSSATRDRRRNKRD